MPLLVVAAIQPTYSRRIDAMRLCPDSLSGLNVDATDLFNDQPLVYTVQPNGYELHTSTPDMFNDAKVSADFKAIFPPLH